MPEEPFIYECHGHIMLDGEDYRRAAERHRGGVDEADLRRKLASLRAAGVGYFRDGGDPLGVSLRAREIAGEYGVDYVTPCFAIHRRGLYGDIVGLAFDTTAELRALIKRARAEGCDFIKLMVSGLIRFDVYGLLSCPSLTAAEITEAVKAAHGEGLRVMAHVNGAKAVRHALSAGADSIEHGYFMDADCLALLRETGAVWVPTLSAVAALEGRAGFSGDVVRRTLSEQMEKIRAALLSGALVAAGSDSGAYGVPHGEGAAREESLIRSACGEAWEKCAASASQANQAIARRFRTEEAR